MAASVRDGTYRDAILLVELPAPGEVTAGVLTAVSPSAVGRLVTRCVSIASRNSRSPLARSCSRMGVSHCTGFSPPQMSLTRMSSRPG